MAMLGFFDESFRDDGLLVVAGYRASEKLWKDLDQEWGAALEASPMAVSEFKTSQCRSGEGPFRNWLPAQRDDLFSRLLAVLTAPKYNGELIGFGAGVVVPRASARRDRQRNFELSYAMCICMVTASVRLSATRDLPDGDFQLYFDAGQRLAASGSRGLKLLPDQLKGRGFTGSIKSPIFVDSTARPGIQAADLLANLTLRDLHRQIHAGYEAPHGPELRRLLSGQFHHAQYINPTIWRETLQTGYMRPNEDLLLPLYSTYPPAVAAEFMTVMARTQRGDFARPSPSVATTPDERVD